MLPPGMFDRQYFRRSTPLFTLCVPISFEQLPTQRADAVVGEAAARHPHVRVRAEFDHRHEPARRARGTLVEVRGKADRGRRQRSLHALRWLPSMNRLYASDTFQIVDEFWRNPWSMVAPMFLRTRPLVCSPRIVS